MRNIETIIDELKERKDHSAWDKGVTLYAIELAEQMRENIEGGYINPETVTDRATLKREILNGAQDWHQYSWGGSSLVYDEDIAARLCNPSELKKTHNGQRRPNRYEEWLDTQARALRQAEGRILRAAF